MARVRRAGKRRASEDNLRVPAKKQCVEEPHKPEKRIAANIALHTVDILRDILTRVPLLDRIRARRINNPWKNTVDTFPNLHNVPFFEPVVGPREFLFWQPYDRLGNVGPVITEARWEADIQAWPPVSIITVHPLLERMDASVKNNAPRGSALASEPTPLKFCFKLRLRPEWLIVMERDCLDRKWRDMLVTQPPCTELPLLDIKAEDGITLGMLADKFVEWQRMQVKKLMHETPRKNWPVPGPSKVELMGMRDGSFWVRMATGEIERGSLFVPAVHGF